LLSECSFRKIFYRDIVRRGEDALGQDRFSMIAKNLDRGIIQKNLRKNGIIPINQNETDSSKKLESLF
jgi:hypothetical protein